MSTFRIVEAYSIKYPVCQINLWHIQEIFAIPYSMLKWAYIIHMIDTNPTYHKFSDGVMTCALCAIHQNCDTCPIPNYFAKQGVNPYDVHGCNHTPFDDFTKARNNAYKRDAAIREFILLRNILNDQKLLEAFLDKLHNELNSELGNEDYFIMNKAIFIADTYLEEHDGPIEN